MMKQAQYQPGEPGDAQVQSDDGHWTLVFVRELKHSPADVWSVLTVPAQLREWAPFDSSRDLGMSGEATLTMAGTTPEPFASMIGRAEPHSLLEYTWGDDLLRWNLEPSGTGTRLTLRHTMGDRAWLPKVAAGWHICLDVAECLLDGEPVGRIVADDARQHGWERLNDAYAKSFGIPSSGWPEEPASVPRQK